MSAEADTTRQSQPMKTILAAASPNTAARIQAILDHAAPGWFEVARAASFSEIYLLLNEQPRDLLLLDWQLRGMSLSAITGLRSSEPSLATVVFTTPDDTSISHKVVRAGVQECICIESLDSRNLRNLLRSAVQRQQTSTASEAGLRQRCTQLMQLLPVDEATGLHNAQSFTEHLDKEIHRSTRYGHPFSLVLLEIDSFPALEDTYGPRSFLTILRLLADVLRANFRKIDEMGRVGKARFGILCVESTPAGVAIAIQRIMQSLHDHPLKIGGGISVLTSISCGILPWSAGMDSAETMFTSAARLLESAKSKGPGGIEVANASPASASSPHLRLNR